MCLGAVQGQIAVETGTTAPAFCQMISQIGVNPVPHGQGLVTISLVHFCDLCGHVMIEQGTGHFLVDEWGTESPVTGLLNQSP